MEWMAVHSNTHKVADISVRLFGDGQGEPLVFLHGASGVPPWGPFFQTLAQRYRVAMPEHPGFGASDNPPTIRNIADLAMYYLDFLDGFGADKVHLVGNSLGGWIAAEVAARNCSRIKSVTLLAPAGIRVKGMPCGDNFIWGPEETARNLYFDQNFAERMIAQVPTEAEADLALANRYAAAKFGWDPRWFNPALERWVHRIAVPTLVLWGRDDKLFPNAYAARWGELLPNARVDIIPECGHLPHIEKADIAAQKLLGFLGGI
jgi:pimeloyl-ACP methyl ester carboxylesterase